MRCCKRRSSSRADGANRPDDDAAADKTFAGLARGRAFQDARARVSPDNRNFFLILFNLGQTLKVYGREWASRDEGDEASRNGPMSPRWRWRWRTTAPFIREAIRR